MPIFTGKFYDFTGKLMIFQVNRKTKVSIRRNRYQKKVSILLPSLLVGDRLFHFFVFLTHEITIVAKKNIYIYILFTVILISQQVKKTKNRTGS